MISMTSSSSFVTCHYHFQDSGSDRWVDPIKASSVGFANIAVIRTKSEHQKFNLPMTPVSPSLLLVDQAGALRSGMLVVPVSPVSPVLGSTVE